MAEGFAQHYGGEKVQVSSGGSKPADKVNPEAVRVMKEKGIDISSHEPTVIDPGEARNADYVITMGCGPDACPSPVGGKIIKWDLEDPSGEPIQKFRKVRDKVEENIKKLLKDLEKKN